MSSSFFNNTEPEESSAELAFQLARVVHPDLRRLSSVTSPRIDSMQGRRRSDRIGPIKGSLSSYGCSNVTTRGKANAVRTTFPFLSLSAELRIMIYEHALNFNGVTRYLSDFSAMVYEDRYKPSLKMSTPGILLVNRQIFAEASHVLYQQPLEISQLFCCHQVESLISPALIRNLNRISLSGSCADDESFLHWIHHHRRFISNLVDILLGQHNLKRLTISFYDSSFAPHLEAEHNGDMTDCHVAESLRNLFSPFRRLREVKEVVLEGLPAAHFSDLKEVMEGPAKRFLDLPFSIRKKIYGYSLDWNDAVAQIQEHVAYDVRSGEYEPKCPSKRNPNVLLLNRKITSEALDVLRNKPLRLENFIRTHGDNKSTHNLYHEGPHLHLELEDFISRHTLTRIPVIHLKPPKPAADKGGSADRVSLRLASIWATAMGRGELGLKVLRLDLSDVVKGPKRTVKARLRRWFEGNPIASLKGWEKVELVGLGNEGEESVGEWVGNWVEGMMEGGKSREGACERQEGMMKECGSKTRGR